MESADAASEKRRVVVEPGQIDRRVLRILGIGRGEDAIAVAFQWISNFIVSSTFVPMYTWSPAFTYGMYCFFCLLAAFFVWKLVPETKGKTLEDMTTLWRERMKK